MRNLVGIIGKLSTSRPLIWPFFHCRRGDPSKILSTFILRKIFGEIPKIQHKNIIRN
jgi:hypothetical protein